MLPGHASTTEAGLPALHTVTARTAPSADRPSGAGTALVDRHRATTRRRRRWLIGSAILVAAAAVGAYLHAAGAAAATDYVTAPVTRGTVADAVTASGSVNPVLTVQVGSYVSGIIESISCDFNTEVHKGQLCAKIDPRPYETVVAQDQANLATAKAQLDKDQTQLTYATLSYQRATDLERQSLVSQDDLDSAKSAYDQAKAQVALDQSVITQRQAAVQSAQVNVGYTNIVSPVNGTVVSRNVTVGQTVAASFQTPTLFLIANDLTKMQVDANVSESDIGSIRSGDRALFTVDAFAGHQFAGTVTQVRQAPQSVQNVVTYDVVIAVANPDRLLKPGMTAAVHIITEQRDDVLRVPDRALRFDPTGAGPALGGPGRGGAEASAAASTEGPGGPGHVWLLRNGRPIRVAVTVGLDDGTNAEVTASTLAVGDAIIVSERTAGPGAPASPPRPPRFGM
jgi:HlyD family secretion protein